MFLQLVVVKDAKFWLRNSDKNLKTSRNSRLLVFVLPKVNLESLSAIIERRKTQKKRKIMQIFDTHTHLNVEEFAGREEEEYKDTEIVSTKTISNDILEKIVENVGGNSNILKVDACFTRLRLTLKDNSKIIDQKIFEKQLGASGAIIVDNGIQIIYGNKANLFKIELREFLKHE